jgi:hypothetical protein
MTTNSARPATRSRCRVVPNGIDRRQRRASERRHRRFGRSRRPSRRARAGDTTRPVFTDGFNREPDTIYGLPIRYTSNLDAIPAGAGKIAAVVGDFTHAVFALRKDVTVRFSDSGDDRRRRHAASPLAAEQDGVAVGDTDRLRRARSEPHVRQRHERDLSDSWRGRVASAALPA